MSEVANSVVELDEIEDVMILVEVAKSELEAIEEASEDEPMSEDVRDGATEDEIAMLDVIAVLVERDVDEPIDVELAISVLDVKSLETVLDVVRIVLVVPKLEAKVEEVSTAVLEGPLVETELLERIVEVGPTVLELSEDTVLESMFVLV